MILNICADYPAQELATGFWASSWGQETLKESREALTALFLYLTSPRAEGGLQASWDDPAGLRAVHDHIIRNRPEKPSCPA